MLSRKLDEIVVYDSTTRTHEFNGLPATSLGLFSSAFPNALDSSKDNYTTWDLFRIHCFRVVLTIAIFLYMRLYNIHEFITNFFELLGIFTLDYKYQLLHHKKERERNFIFDLANDFVSNWEVIFKIPSLLWKTFRPGGDTPVGLNKCLEYIPKTNTPDSICLVLHCAPPMLKPPPKIPQPYLDSDRTIVIPEKKDVQYVIAIRNEYFTQCKSHIAAERVRLLREIGRFITWCCLVPTITELTIYEKSGNCWKENEDFTNSMKNAILVELVAMANTCNPEELRKFKSVMPKITLVNKFTKERYTVTDDEVNSARDGRDQENIAEEIISGYLDQRTLVVYLCDQSTRTVNFQALMTKADTLTPESEIFSEEFPPIPDLVVGCMNMSHTRNQLEGYACIEKTANVQNMAVVYFSHLRFGFSFFSRALYHYSLEQPFKFPKKNDSDEDEHDIG
ncbi:hypothetical protein KGF56_003584 [Candida oxycetoniae]|uniref:Uncharacterized protein n=1 Tax=Candida oxycetoniae TaxID=497107 RepID=A0AAI9SVG4_9ASCO|nr:uncharacterized protein KGF56_003584 [Candida oxycetoniae]KAI3403657.2 hypothetical protein KGF56_003584 [Candida oxycetoniae]